MAVPAADPYASALEQLTEFGLALDVVEADGRVHRVPHQEDRAGKKNGWYVAFEIALDSGELIIVGAYGWWKEGATYHLRVSRRGLSDQQKRLIAARRRDIAKRVAAERVQLAKEAAQRAAKIWSALPQEGASKYLQRKGVLAYGVRFTQGAVVVPLRTCPDDLVGLQFIDGDGSKRFLTGTAKSGAYHLIGNPPTAGVILAVCEGYATGASVHRAMGWTVAVAFDAGNLKPVTRTLERRYPGCRMVLCADDDQTTAGNPGVTKAREAAAMAGGKLAIPEFAAPGGGDWNDLHAAEGLDALRQQLAGIWADEKGNGQTSGQAPGRIIQGGFPGSEWFDYLRRSATGAIRVSSYNTRLILDNDPAWRDVLGWCCFSHQIVKRIDPPLAYSSAGPWEDGDDVELRFWLAGRYDIEPRGQDLADAVLGAAKAKPFHPVCDYLDACRWDGRQRLDTWLYDYLGVDPAAMEGDPDDAERYIELVGSMWLIQAVSRVRNPGDKADSVLILEGDQGQGKSTALRILFGDEWFSDTPVDIGSKDSYEALRGLWCLEMAELDALSKADSRRAKAFFSSPRDRYRLPYGHRAMLFTRQCVVAGTTNEFAHLKDYTGNRRYWSVSTNNLKLDALARDRDQLWAEADYRYRQGEHWWPHADDLRLFRDQQEARMDVDVWESLIIEYLRERIERSVPEERTEVFVSMAQIMAEALYIDKGSMRRPEQTRIGQIVHRIGWKNCRPVIAGDRVCGYSPSREYLKERGFLLMEEENT